MSLLHLSDFYFVLLLRSLHWNGFKAWVCKKYTGIVTNSKKFFTSLFFSFLENCLGACISLLMRRLNVKDAYCKTIILIILFSILNFKYFFVLRYKRSKLGLFDLNSNMKETGDIAIAYQDYISLTGSILGKKVKIWYNYNVRHDFQFWTNVDWFWSF